MLFVVTPERVLVEGETGSVATDSDLRAYVGIAPDLFAANAGFRAFMTAFYKDQRFDGDAFLHQQNPFARRNVTAIVLEVPSELIGKGKINAWATISLLGHAPEVQVSRWGLPMVTHLFLDDPSNQNGKEQFNESVPSEDLERFAKSIADFAEKMTTYAGSTEDPSEYGKLIAARLCPRHIALRAWNTRRISGGQLQWTRARRRCTGCDVDAGDQHATCRWTCSRPVAH